MANLSANTESKICQQVCINNGIDGFTVTQITPPHPVWTNNNGDAVAQLNMVVIGGPNGLNG